jgi:hypothetical protein
MSYEKKRKIKKNYTILRLYKKKRRNQDLSAKAQKKRKKKEVKIMALLWETLFFLDIL